MSVSCDTVDCSLPGSSVHGISQARILEWVAVSPGYLPSSGIEPVSSALAGGFFTAKPRKPGAVVLAGKLALWAIFEIQVCLIRLPNILSLLFFF